MTSSKISTLDVGRTRRALSLHVEQLSDSEYVITGGAQSHTVTTSEIPWRCDCLDSFYRPSVSLQGIADFGPCKHALATYLVRQLAPAIRAALLSAVGAS